MEGGMNHMTENVLEETCLYWLEELGWQVVYGPNIAPGLPDAERTVYSEVVPKRIADIFCGCETTAFEARRNSIDF
jgi:hypothetical protein